jgi:two-component system nitrate/nitrite response regulator NarL
MTKAIRIAVIDDHPLFREGVTRSLAEIGGFEIVGEGSTKDDALRIAAEKHPDIVLLDISMPGGGLSAVSAILDLNPAQKIVMLTVSEASDDVAKALNGGARGYVLKGVGARALAEILTTVAAGESYISPTLSARVLSALSESSAKRDPIAGLTDREREVLALVAAGLSNKRVALKLDLHEKTVKHHMTRIFAKLHVNNRTEAAIAFRDAADRR